MTDKLNKLDKEKKRRNLIIHGVLEDKDKHPKSTSEELFADIKSDITSTDYDAIYRMGSISRNPGVTRPIMVTLTKANSKGNIYLHVKNLKGLQKWKGISIADDLTPDLNLKGLQKLKGISIADDLTPGPIENQKGSTGNSSTRALQKH